MGLRGPKPKDPKINALQGNPSKRPVRVEVEEADPSSGSLRMPTRLTEEERRVWTDTIEAFPSYYFTMADKYLLLAYCRAVARVERSEKALQKSSTVLERANGSKCLNPHIAAVNLGVAQIKSLAEALAITRRTRRGMTLPIGVALSEEMQDSKSGMDGDGLEAFGDLVAPAI